MKVVWGKFGTGVDLIVCAISSYWWVSLWVNEKDAFHAYSLKTSIIVFLGIMLSFWGYEKKIEWEDFTVIQRYNDHFFFNISKQKDDSLFWCTYHPFTSIMIFDKFRAPSWGIIPLSADEFGELLTSYGVKYTESK